MVLWRNVNKIKETWKTEKVFFIVLKKISADKYQKKRKLISLTFVFARF